MVHDTSQSLARLKSELAGHHADGRIPDAIASAEQILALTLRQFGEDDLRVVDSLNNLGALHASKGALAEARRWYQRAVNSLDRSGEDRGRLAETLADLAAVAESAGDFAGAQASLVRVLDIREAGAREHPIALAVALADLGNLYRRSDNFLDAEPLCSRAVEIQRQHLSGVDPELARSLNDLGSLCTAMGDYARAETLLRDACAVWRERHGDHHPSVAVTLHNLGSLYRFMGRYRQAEECLRRALETQYWLLEQRHPEVAPSDIAATLESFGILNRVTGNYTEAERCYLTALRIWRTELGESSPVVATTMGSLALLYEFMSRSPSATLPRQKLEREARERHAQALQATTATGGSPQLRASLLSNYGRFLASAGEYEPAEFQLREAVRLRRLVSGERSPEYATTLDNLGLVCAARGRLSDAEQLLRDALFLRRERFGEKHPDIATSLVHLARLHASAGRLEDARALLDGAVDIDDHMIEQVCFLGSEEHRLAYLDTIQATTAEYFSLVRRTSNGPAPAGRAAVNAAFDLALRRKGLTAEVLAIQRDAPPVAEPGAPHGQRSLLDRRSELTRLRREIARKTFAGPERDAVGRHEARLSVLAARVQRLEAELGQEFRDAKLLQLLRAADRKAIASALEDATALVEFVRYAGVAPDLHHPFRAAPRSADRYLAFVLRAGQPDGIEMIDLGQAGRVDRLVNGFVDAIRRTPLDAGEGFQPAVTDKRIRVAGQALSAVLLAQLWPRLDGCVRLLLATDSNLTRLPFEALTVGDDWLIERFEISYIGSARDVLRFGAEPGSPSGRAVVAADPAFVMDVAPDGHAGLRAQSRRVPRPEFQAELQFPPLPGTREEGCAIARQLRVEPWLGEMVLEGRLKACRSPSILHLATHGFFLQDEIDAERIPNPLLRSCLALAGAETFSEGNGAALPEDAEDGILTAEDVSGLDLSGTELVVLSACETGLGDVRTGEGVFGLRRAFFLAGAKALVMSLWAVGDDETRQLMLWFYESILKGRPRAQGLRDAQLKMISHLRKRGSETGCANPFYWAGFIYQGDPGPLSTAVLRTLQGSSRSDRR